MPIEVTERVPNSAHWKIQTDWPGLKFCEGNKKTMPNSKRRKRQIAAKQKQLEKAKRQLEMLKEESQKENIYPPANKMVKEDGDEEDSQDGPSWIGGLYSWCQSGISQVIDQRSTLLS